MRIRIWPAPLTLFLLAITNSSCQERLPDAIPADQHFVTMRDLLQIGQRRAERYLQTLTPPIPNIDDSRWAVVRVESDFGDYRMDSATGVLVAEGRFALTAAHAMDRVVEDSNGRISVRVRTRSPDGTATVHKVDASIVAQSDKSERGRADWCVLELQEQPAGLAALKCGDRADQETLVAMGFPVSLGLGPGGQIVSWPKDQVVQPFLHLVKSSDPSGALLQPLAGFSSQPGMSGSPVINRKGKVVALIIGMTTRTELGVTTEHTRVSTLHGAKAFLDKHR